MTTRRERRGLDALYASLPALECQGRCAESCGPIVAGPVELARLVEATGAEPTVDDDLTCSLLVDERCSAYAVRPAICRLWGLVESMRCPWGCVPSRVLTDAEGFEVLRRAGLG